jgi:Tol biopolymer transport system component
MFDNSLRGRDTSKTALSRYSGPFEYRMPRQTAWLIVVALTALWCGVTALASDLAREKQLQRGIDLLERNDLSPAAALFEEAARSTDQELAARALLHLAAAQERQGDKDRARATYKRILQQFSHRHEAVADARTRLARLERPVASAAPASRRVLTGDDADPRAHVTPDGRFLSRADRRTGDIVVRDMTTDRSKRLLVTRDVPESSPEHAELAMISPDGSRIAYVWLRRGEGNETRYQLRMIRNEVGAASRVLVDDARYSYFEPIGWSPDGQSLLVTAWRDDNSTELARVPLNGGALQRLKDMRFRLGPTPPRLSPDGRYIAYSAMPTNPPTLQEARTSVNTGQPLHVYVLATSAVEQKEIEVVKGSNVNESPIWTPDGKQMLFVSNRSADGFGLWSVEVEVEDDRGFNERRIRANFAGRIRPLGMTKSGTLYYLPEAASGTGVDVFVADWDAENSRVKGRAAKLVDTVVDRSLAPSWSPDGERIAFKRRRASGTLPPNAEPVEVVIHSQKGGEEAVFPLPGVDNTPPLWLDNDRYLLVRANGGSLHQLDRKTGRTLSLENVAHSRLPPECGPHALSADGRTLFLAVLDPIPAGRSSSSQPVQRTRRIVAFDVETGDQKDVMRPQPITALGMLAVSPDGRSLAVAMQRESWQAPRLVIVDVQTGTVQELKTVIVPRTAPRAASWTRAGLLVSRGTERKADVVRVSVPDGKVTPTGLTYASGQFFDVRADGQRVVFSDRTRPDEEELWASENVLSYVKPVH